MRKKLVLVGNPNIGKSSLFNRLTGMRQKVGNFSGVTIEKKSGFFEVNGEQFELIDLPGTYSLIAKSPDEEIVSRQILDPVSKPDLVLVVLDAANLERNMLLFSQIADLRLPVVVALNMLDLAEKRGLKINMAQFGHFLGCPVIGIHARNGMGIEELKENLQAAKIPDFQIFDPKGAFDLKKESYKLPDFENWLGHINGFASSKNNSFDGFPEKSLAQARETVFRYKKVKEAMASFGVQKSSKGQFGFGFDKVALHPVFGYGLMLLILLLVFEAIFKFSAIPMDWIETSMAFSIDFFDQQLPDGILKRLFLEGILAGIQGIVIFIPQIAILFLLIGLMEESGYMARVMVLLDQLMKRMGLSGKAVIPLVSGVACAVPAIMSTRSMTSQRERLIAIFVTPLMSCSARLPVFTLLIGMLVPGTALLGPFSWQGLSLFGLYLIGLLGAVLTAAVLHQFMPGKGHSTFVLELPPYQMPHWKNLWITVYQKSASFVLEAGKVILAISIILWFLAGFGPGDEMEKAYKLGFQTSIQNGLGEEEAKNIAQSQQLEASYAGKAGKWIEPALNPLGFDWKIGVALITSFAAREVFVGTMSVLYASGNEGESEVLTARMLEARNAQTGKPVFTGPVVKSLLVFYIFAMQCMSTLAVSYRETQSWKWPILQLFYMSGLAYLMSFLVYQFLA